MRNATIALTIAALVASCSGKSPANAANATAQKAGQSAAAPAGQTALSGTVLEALDAGAYTYLKIATSDGEKWAAVPAVKIAKGESVTIDTQMVAEQFESKTLNRKFDKIAFGTVAGPKTAAAGGMGMPSQMPPGHPATGAPAGEAAQHMQAPQAGDVKVARAEGGKTVAEIWAAKESGKEVVVRGKIVKFLPGIMGKNWLHLRDGSGSQSKGDDDITVTTNDVAAVGDVVVVRGKVAVDKDFGAGYRYPVIIEEAKLTK